MARENICVRNYNNGGVTNPCETFPEHFVYVVPEMEQIYKTCTRYYPKSSCDLAPEFTTILAENGKEVCVLNYNQQTLNLCETLPDYYTYVRKAYSLFG